MTAGRLAPLAPGSISLRLYPHNDLPAPRLVEELRTQAALAAEHGFDGVMTSEHHGGFAGYLPNPLQAAGWLLEVMPTGWAAPCPLLLPLRPTALVAEEIAWLAARFPGRVGLGVAAGALPADFELMGASMEGLTERFVAALERLVALVGARSAGDADPLAGDAAIGYCANHPVPLVSAAMGFTAVRRAARLGVGVIFDSLASPERWRRLTDAYRDSGGTGPCILIRRAWVGEPPRDQLERQTEVYRTYSPESVQRQWTQEQVVTAANPNEVAERLASAVDRAGCDSLNLRVQVPGVSPEAAREQIVRLGDEVLPTLRRR